MATTEDSLEWETLRPGLGEEWDFDRRGPLVGTYEGPTTVPLQPSPADPRTETTAYEFTVHPDGERVFVWASYELAQALTEAGVGDLLRVELLGRSQFVGPDGPRTVKRYRVQRAKRR